MSAYRVAGRSEGGRQSWRGPYAQFFLPVIATPTRHHDLAFGFLRSVDTAANLTTDVQLAAIAVENDATICSNDADFARFGDVRWVNPLAPK